MTKNYRKKAHDTAEPLKMAGETADPKKNFNSTVKTEMVFRTEEITILIKQIENRL